MGHTQRTEIIAKRVNASRDSLGIPVNRLAETTGIPRTTLSRKLEGKSEFTATELLDLGDHMHIDAEVWIKGLAKVTQ